MHRYHTVGAPTGGVPQRSRFGVDSIVFKTMQGMGTEPDDRRAVSRAPTASYLPIRIGDLNGLGSS
jgi:hypothetical protein